MITHTRALAVLGAVVVTAQGQGLGAQQQPQRQPVQMSDIMIERRPLRSDSLIDQVFAGDPASVKRLVSSWRERETQLMRELRAVPEGDLVARRRVDQQLQRHMSDGFAIMSAIQARCINEGGPRPAGYLGLNLTNTFVVENNQPKALGTTVTSVEQGSPAARAGVQRGDKVLSLAGLDATERTPDVAPQLIPGRTMTIRIERAGTARDLTLTIARRPEGFGDSCDELERELLPMRIAGPGRIIVEDPRSGMRGVMLRSREETARPELPPEEVRIEIFRPGAQEYAARGFFAGAEFRMLDADWGEVLGVQQGVIVNGVAQGSAAALSGLRGGDVVTAVGRSPVATPLTLVQILGTMEETEAVLSVVRAKERRTITLKWGGRER